METNKEAIENWENIKKLNIREIRLKERTIKSLYKQNALINIEIKKLKNK